MRTPLAALCFCLLLVPINSPASAPARENPLFDRYYTSIGFEEEKVRLNNYAIQLQNGPGSRGLIIVYSESDAAAKSAQARARRAMRYLVKKHGVSAGKLSWRYEGACGREQVLLYVLYPNEADPLPDANCRKA